MDIQGIKDWLEEGIDFFTRVSSKDGNLRDIQQNIESNRRLFGIPYRKREEIKDWVQANKPKALTYLAELSTWMSEYYHYFDEGYKAPHAIDELPDMILGRLKFIREKIESL